MKGDFTRSTFRSQKHYTSVRMQQGRVQLDADWNEQMDITARRIGIGSSDITGRYAVPFLNPGFLIGGGAVPSIGKGRLYLDDGFLIENDEDILITEQDEFLPDYSLPTAAGDYLAYLVSWERHVTALEDELIREVALGGPDTTTRTQTVWQVHLLALNAPATCSSDPEEWQDVYKIVPGQLRAHTASGTQAANLCEVPAGAGYRRLENQLYRVEIHTPGKLGVATYKWSRDNGSIVTSWTDQDGSDLIVTNPGRDQVLGFAAGQTVELTDDDRELRGEPGVLVKLSKVEGQVLTLDSSAPAVDLSTFGRNPKVRRWDSELETVTDEDWMPVEDGVEVRFEDGCDYRTGDYWMIPARTAKSDIEWPADETNPTEPAAVVRQGILRHYCKLATLYFDGTNFSVKGDCRPKFPPLTMLTSLYYVGGDGQEAMPGDELPQLLEVRVACGGWVLEGATVEFTAEGNGRLAAALGGTGASTVNTLSVDTGPDGVARCAWKPEADLANPSQQVTARLMDADGNQVTNELGELAHVVHLTANLSIAGQVAYESGKCLLNADTVKEALDQLCSNYTLYYVGGDGQEAKPGAWLEQPLQVRVANGDLPMEGVEVIFEVVEGEGGLIEGGQCHNSVELPKNPEKKIVVRTGEDGLTSCCWKLDEKNLSQRVAVTMAAEKYPLIYFNASLSVADQVAYESKSCLTDAPTVKDALDQLCEKVSELSLSQKVTLYYVGGDGQEARPDNWLPRPLQVRAAMGGYPSKDVAVEFNVMNEGDGGLVEGDDVGNAAGRELHHSVIIIKTNEEGLASCCWKLNNGELSQRVSAGLEGAAASLYFNASLSTGTGLEAGGVINGVFTHDETGQKLLLQNDARIGPQHLASGIVVGCSEDIDPASVNGKPVGYVTLDIPGKDIAGIGSAGYQTVGLNGSLIVEAEKLKEIRWQPDQSVIEWASKIWDLLGTDRLLARFVLKGNFIWARQDTSRYLDGTSFGKNAGAQGTIIIFPTGDGRRGGDFEMWFWLTKDPPWISAPAVEITGILVDSLKPTAGSNITATITLSEAAPEGGLAVDISGVGAALDAPATIFVPAGATEVTFNMKANEVSETTKTTLLASLGGATRQRTVTITPKE